MITFSGLDHENQVAGTFAVTVRPLAPYEESDDVKSYTSPRLGPRLVQSRPPSDSLPPIQEVFARKRLLLILSARILDSSVERGSPRRAAAPEGP